MRICRLWLIVSIQFILLDASSGVSGVFVVEFWVRHVVNMMDLELSNMNKDSRVQ